MKSTPLYLLLILTLMVSAYAKATPVFHLDKLSGQDIPVTGWVFHAGDNSQWQQPNFDDKGWKAVDPTIDVSHFNELKQAGEGWLRVHIRVDSSIAGQTIAFSITQYTASEVYLNGKLLIKYGTVSGDPSAVKAYLPSKAPFVVKLVPGKDNILAVKIAYQHGLPYISSLFEKLSAFAVFINDYQSAVTNNDNYQDSIKSFLLMFGLFGGMLLIIFFIYLVYYLFNRDKKIYLYYTLFCFCICYVTLPNELFGVGRFGPVASQMWLTYLEGVGFVIGMLFLLLTVYTIVNYTRRTVFIFLSVFGAICVVFMYINGQTGFFICTSLVPFIFMVEGIRACIWAIRHKVRDAGYILGGTVCFVMFIGVSGMVEQNTILAQLLWGVGIVCFPLGMAFYLGIQGSIINKQLTASLAEVQTLSAQKQQILADQNLLLEQQVTERTQELHTSLENLKSAQNQLVQSEKMASLGELTAGIAHEIQNPLNFVNNFSEVSIELLDELKEEEEKGNKEEVIAIAADLAENLSKINHHGKRADSIVKGMLEHSRASTGQKEPTDINKLADEYLRLAYHGLRAKDKSFNAELVTNFDESLPPVKVIPQDMGRVMLNLFNNAFYAVHQKQKTAGKNYKPTIEVTTTTKDSLVQIIVKDNGSGIPDGIKDKIMQPFFTTKPTGEGTGLGLSLSYDIVVKGHGGKINVDSAEGAGTEFVIFIPSS